MLVLFQRPRLRSPNLNSEDGWIRGPSSCEKQLLMRVLNKLQKLLLENPTAAVIVLKAVDRWINDM